MPEAERDRLSDSLVLRTEDGVLPGNRGDGEHCGRAGARKKCSRCKQSYYCSATCQKAHWKAEHKKVWKKPTAALADAWK